MREVIEWTLLAAWLCYIFSSAVLDTHKLPVFSIIWSITKWPALAQPIFNIAGQIFLDHEAPSTFDILFFLFQIWIWWRNRNSGDDDDVRKLRERMTESVKEMGGKLVIVPNTA